MHRDALLLPLHDTFWFEQTPFAWTGLISIYEVSISGKFRQDGAPANVSIYENISVDNTTYPILQSVNSS